MKFGTSGLRGLVSDMTDEVCAAYVRAFLAHLSGAGSSASQALIGRDLRPSSPRIAAACLEAIRAAGLTAVDCGVLPTPALALEATERKAPAIMVTGSHIPFDRNGLKFYRSDGEIAKADEAGIVAALERCAAPAATPGALREDAAARARYLDRARAFPASALAGMRIGVYQHSAAGRDLIPAALESLGAEAIPLGRAEGFVPIDTEAVRDEDRALASEWTAAHRLDALVTTDGDGDRPLIADETGAFLRGDILGVLTARFLDADAVATPISSNSALERSGWFAKVARTRIGSPFVIEAMEALAAEGARLPVGFEANGGFLLGGPATPPGGARLEPLPTRDAMVPMLSALCMAARAGRPLSMLAADLPRRATASDRLQNIPSERSKALIDALGSESPARTRILAALGAPAVDRVDLTDGVRLMLAGDEVIHLRASGNAPELRCYAEAREGRRAADLVAQVIAALRED
jgi:phosphomannomutase